MPEIDFELFRENLKNIRDARNLTGKELSVNLKLRQMKRISDIEDGRGKPTLEEINSICDYFGFSIDDMMKKKAIVTIDFVYP